MEAGPVLLPPEVPIAMPEQRFGGEAPVPRRVTTTPPGIASRRMLLLVAVLVLATAASGEVRLALVRDGFGAGDAVLTILFFLLFAWIAFGFVNATIGFLMLIGGHHPGFVPPPRWRRVPAGRTAVLVPVHNEDVAALMQRLAAMTASIAAEGGAERFTLFVLSDSDAAASVAESAACAALASRSAVPVHYRRRDANVGRKPGNVMEWVRRWGGGYDYMLVLDADSLMSGSAMLSMASLMDERPTIGLLQTVPAIIAAETRFQRWMQFANRLYGPIASAGLLWWSGSEATFWGHNAIVRTAAFAESCGLPVLPGAPPFGGHLLSHDMVEAALLRRRGWAVHMVMIAGSYEEFPPTMPDQGVRDRRWMQGNLQHLRLLGSAGFHSVSRVQLLLGACAFLASPAWLLLILVTLAQALWGGGVGDAAAAAPPSSVLASTLLLLFGPKAMALGWAMADRKRRHAFGGGRALVRSVAVDLPLATLTAPATMLTQTIDLFGILAGRSAGWQAQNRAGGGLSLRRMVRHYRWHLALGTAFLGVAPFAPVAALWLAPVTLGLLLAPWLAVWTADPRGPSRPTVDLFQVPEASMSVEDAAARPRGSPVAPVAMTAPAD